MIKVNNEQQLFVIKCGEGFSCLGFDVCQKRTISLKSELDRMTAKPLTAVPKDKTSIEAYDYYQHLITIARDIHEEHGIQFTSELEPVFIGKEGRRVKVTDCYDDTRTFTIGKSTGFIPCHIELKRRNSRGGCSVFGAPFKSIQWLS